MWPLWVFLSWTVPYQQFCPARVNTTWNPRRPFAWNQCFFYHCSWRLINRGLLRLPALMRTEVGMWMKTFRNTRTHPKAQTLKSTTPMLSTVSTPCTWFQLCCDKPKQTNKQTKIHVFHLHLPGINGIMFGGTLLSTCQTDVTFWHVANVGTQSNFLSAYFTGNAFQYNGLRQSVLTLFPMTSMTVIMEMDLPGNHIQPLESTLVTFAQWKLHGSLVKNII